MRTILYVSTNVNDTDFTAKLVDVQPNGRPLLVTDGIQRLRYRLSLNAPIYVKRGEEYQISVDTGVTSYVFAPGHEIRLEVSSSNFPRFDRNLNLPGPLADQTKMIKARQTLFHQKGYPSAIILPIIARTRVMATERKLPNQSHDHGPGHNEQPSQRLSPTQPLTQEDGRKQNHQGHA